MNKKGFAVSIILYSLVFLIVTILFMLLAIARTRYSVSDRLRKTIVSDLNENMGYTPFVSSGSCTIVGDSDDYSYNLVLSIDSNVGSQYSWDDNNWSMDNSITVDRNGIYKGYFIDNVGGKGNCQAEVISKTMYHVRECASDDYNFGNWYMAHANTCTDGVSLKSGGVSVDMEYAESHNLTYYYTSCTDTCCKEYNRTIDSCKWEKNETWGTWQDNRPASSTNQIESMVFYKIKN